MARQMMKGSNEYYKIIHTDAEDTLREIAAVIENFDRRGCVLCGKSSARFDFQGSRVCIRCVSQAKSTSWEDLKPVTI